MSNETMSPHMLMPPHTEQIKHEPFRNKHMLGTPPWDSHDDNPNRSSLIPNPRRIYPQILIQYEWVLPSN